MYRLRVLFVITFLQMVFEFTTWSGLAGQGQNYLLLYGRATGQLDVAPPPPVAEPDNLLAAAIAKQRVMAQVGRRFLEILQAEVEDDALAEVDAAPIIPASTRVHPADDEPENTALPSPVPTAPTRPPASPPVMSR